MKPVHQPSRLLPLETVLHIFEPAAGAFAIVDAGGHYLGASVPWQQRLGLDRHSSVGAPFIDDLDATFVLDDKHQLLRSCVELDAFTSDILTPHPVDAPFDRVRLRSRRYRNERGDGVALFLEEVTTMKETEDALRLVNGRLEEAQRLARLGYWEWDLQTNEVTWTGPIYDMWGYDPQEKPSLTYEDYFAGVPAEEQEAVASWVEDAIARKKPFYFEHQVRRPDGSRRTIAIDGRVELDAQNEPLKLLGAAQDVSDRRSLEEQLQHAQKLEATGRLAGGIAHDFNNILTAIFSFGTFAIQSLEAGHAAHEDIQEVLRAAEQAKSLTAQLLAFSRRRTVVPRVIQLNQSVLNADAMIRRLLGEHISIVLELRSDLWNARIDPDAFEQVIVNLAVNARDAMRGGGNIRIATQNAELDAFATGGKGGAIPPGEYVEFSLSDDGEGMSAEVQRQIFEPFFTTKPAGEGSGLGLATCYGIIRQAGGYILVRSALRQGTTFKIYLPRVHHEVEQVEKPERPASEAGQETILVVEDNPQVRKIAERTLRQLGYTVHVAPDGPAALAWLAEGTVVPSLLLTDVVMPKMSGQQLAEKVCAEHPEVRVLFISGYSEKTIVQHGVLEDGIELLQKPFHPEDLANRVRQVLGERDATSQS